MFKKILLVVAVLIVAFVIVVLTRPEDFRVSRSAAMDAPPVAVFGQVNDFHKWEAWSPWAKLDPNCKYTYDGPAEGVGAKFGWDGNKDVGTGNMEITESRPSDLIRLRLEFIKPFASTCTTEFTFTPQEGKTLVTWTMTGKNNFIAKAVSMFMDCDKMVGPDFEKGLAKMKEISEAGSKTPSS